MKLEVGDYVRTNKGLIAKYIGYEKDEENIGYSEYRFDGKIYWFYEYYNDCVYEEDFQEWFKEKVVKVSHDITDLIEAGDYVNGYKVLSGGEKHFDYILTWDDVENHYMKIPLLSVDIKSIVTKEQFESMSYKVGEFNDD